MTWSLVRLVWLWTALIAPWSGLAQSADVSDALHGMSDRAGIIFVGTVSGIRRVPGTGETAGAVEISFAVEQAVAGCTAGSTYTLREWPGLWAANDQRYRVGQRLLMLLHAAGPGGLSAPVDGLRGAIPVVGTAPAVGPASTTAQSAANTAVADLRWVSAAAVIRPMNYLVPTAQLPAVHGTAPHATARAQSAPGGGPAAGTSSPASDTTVPEDAGTTATQTSAPSERVSTLLTRIAQWEVSRVR